MGEKERKLSLSVVGNLFKLSQEVTEAKFELISDYISHSYSSATCGPLWGLIVEFRKEIFTQII